MTTFILDSSAWIAFITQETGTKRVADLVESADVLLVPFTVLEEIAAVLHHRFSNQIALESIEYLSQSKQCQILCHDSESSQQLVSFWKSQPDFIDFVDASLIWWQKNTKQPILTLDAHFSKVGCKVG